MPIIELDSELGEKLGFTSAKFSKGSYLWLDKKRILISFIASRKRRKGYLRSLFENIEASGYLIAVPSPLLLMETILEHWGFEMCTEYDHVIDEYVEVWMKPDKRLKK